MKKVTISKRSTKYDERVEKYTKTVVECVKNVYRRIADEVNKEEYLRVEVELAAV